MNCGSVDPDKLGKFPEEDSISPMLASAWEHCELLDRLGFTIWGRETAADLLPDGRTIDALHWELLHP